MTTIADPKSIQYDRETKDYRASYEDNVIGWYNSYLEAEEALNDYASDLTQQTAIDTADMLANSESDADDYAECVSCGDLYACNSEASRPPYICPACKEVGDLLPEPQPNLLEMYRTTYGWSCVELDERQVMDRAA